MSQLISYPGQFARIFNYFCDYVKRDPEFAKCNPIFIDHKSRTDYEPSNTNRPVLELTATIGESVIVECLELESTFILGIGIQVPSYYLSDGLNFWEIVSNAIVRSTLKEYSMKGFDDLGISRITRISPAVSTSPGDPVAGSIEFSFRYSFTPKR